MEIPVRARYAKKDIYKPKTRGRTSSTKLSSTPNFEESHRIMTTITRNMDPVFSSSKTMVYNPSGTSQQLETFRDTRIKEKSEMQDLNTRFAQYIETSRYNAALTKKLKEAIERMKNYPAKTAEDIKNMYEIELQQLRNLIADSEKERDNENDKNLNFQDDYAELEENLNEFKAKEDDNRETLKQQFENLGEYEAKIARLQREIELATEEKDRNKNNIEKLRKELNDIKTKVAIEMRARMNHQDTYNELKNELAILKELNAKELSDVKFIPYEDKINQFRNWWSNEFSNSIQEIQQEYEARLSAIKNEMQSNYACKVHEIQTSASRSNVESAMMKDKYTVLKESSSKLRNILNDTKQENLLLNNQNEHLEIEYNDLQNQYSQLLEEKESEMLEVRQQAEKTVAELKAIMENNVELQQEIEQYKILLETGEAKIGIDSYTPQKSVTYRNQSHTMVKGELQEHTNFKKNHKGFVAISETDRDGSYIQLENTSNSHTVDLSGWKIMQNTDNIDFSEFEIENLVIKPGRTAKIWANGMGNPSHDDIVWYNKPRLGVGAKVSTALLNTRGDEKATYNLETTYNL